MKKIGSFLLSVLMLLSCAACMLLGACAPKREFLNVIVVIGDGMGENHILNAIDYYGLEIPVFMRDQKGYIKTNSLDGTTDSAASGTALSTGNKVHNSNVAMLDGENLESITEIAKAAGMKTGVLTTDTLDGATPAAFSAHAPSRNNSLKILQSQAASKIDLLVGRYASNYALRDTDFTSKGFAYVDTNIFDLRKVDKNSRVISMLWDMDSHYISGLESNTPLKDSARFAVEHLENKNGFFLMIEGAYIDKNSHNNNFVNTMAEVRALFDTIEYLYEYAADGKTAIFITADHETGGLQRATSSDEMNSLLYTTTDHTPVDVPLFVKNYSFNAQSFGYADGATPENTVVFEACNAIIKGTK